MKTKQNAKINVRITQYYGARSDTVTLTTDGATDHHILQHGASGSWEEDVEVVNEAVDMQQLADGWQDWTGCPHPSPLDDDQHTANIDWMIARMADNGLHLVQLDDGSEILVKI